ncbi:MAG: hypothetical protein ATN35_11750 [Epulopiscium sp. Nele67-Bin004]|nr:MAG: hypothetical protein ATN35_11750 [Epulopiscium sp. Nele67-Bin004]
MKENLEVAREKTEVMVKLQQDGQFNLLSPMLHHQLENGSVHFFEPKGSNGKNDQGLYIVIALDMVALEHIQLHIHKVDKDLNIHLFVENKEIQSYLQPHLTQLIKIADEEGYKISGISIDTNNKEETPSINLQAMANISNFDFKI